MANPKTLLILLVVVGIASVTGLHAEQNPANAKKEKKESNPSHSLQITFYKLRENKRKGSKSGENI